MLSGSPASPASTPLSSASVWTLTIPWEPWAKKRPRISRPVKGRAPRTHQDPADKKAEERTREYLQEHWRAPKLYLNLGVTAVFFRSSRQVVDLDNLLKHLLDSANGLLWHDDCQVTSFGDTELRLDRDNPRTELTLFGHETEMLRDYSGRA